MKKYRVKLNVQQRERLERVVSSGKAPARTIRHAHILLKADESPEGPQWSDEQIQQAFGAGTATIWRVRRRCVEQGVDDALHRRPQPERPEKRKLHGEQEAHLIALTCGEKPEGEGRWSLRLLANKLVEVGEVERVSYETVRRTLKKTNSSRG
jgi:transposase